MCSRTGHFAKLIFLAWNLQMSITVDGTPTSYPFRTRKESRLNLCNSISIASTDG